ncbi:MAG TPA: hypothetical protein VKB61_03140 [Candidatus Acidoferrum sp.]|nr:hypothetical protein [Candidatus Acidoferrum sp.]
MATTVSSISPDNPSDAIKTILAAIVEHAGGDFVGLQEPMPEQNLAAYVLFNHPRHRSTLALRLDESFSTDAILRRLAECDEKYKDCR